MKANHTHEAHIFAMDDDDTEAISMLVHQFEADVMSLFRKRQLTCNFKEGHNAPMLTNLLSPSQRKDNQYDH